MKNMRIEVRWRYFSLSTIHECALCWGFSSERSIVWASEHRQGYHHNWESDGSGAGFSLEDKPKRWPSYRHQNIPEIYPVENGRQIFWMDDLFFCPICGRFHPASYLLKVDDTRRKFAIRMIGSDEVLYQSGHVPSPVSQEKLLAELESRKTVPEYVLRLCGTTHCAAARKHRVVVNIREETDGASHVQNMPEGSQDTGQG